MSFPHPTTFIACKDREKSRKFQTFDSKFEKDRRILTQIPLLCDKERDLCGGGGMKTDFYFFRTMLMRAFRSLASTPSMPSMSAAAALKSAGFSPPRRWLTSSVTSTMSTFPS